MHKTVLGAALLAAACFPRVGPPPTALTEAQVVRAQGQWPDTSAVELEHGRQVFLDHCQDCHGYPDLQFRTAEAWPKSATRMAHKGDVDPRDVDPLIRFILTAR
jgi:hypothetical protein